MATIEVVLGDITSERTDAIVTAANESLMGGGGVDGAIHRAAGPRLAAAGAAIAPCDPGDAKATPAFDLDPPVRHVIHTVGPVWEGGDRGEVELLASCYRRCLEVADEIGARSVALPAIATGVYGFPAEEAARIAVATIASTPTSVQRIRLIAFDRTAHDLLAAEVARHPAADDDAVLLAALNTAPDAWERLLAVADDFAALPQAEGDVRWEPAEKRPDGAIVVGYPVYGERVRRACDALSGVGAVTPKYHWMQHQQPEPPPDGVLPTPADAIRLATATVRGERFCDGTIGTALERGTLQAALASLAAWYRT
ncbi:macro domain-containing protein [Actinomadura sp. 9N407]|uniref:macro domain-containing protein n=1 Tax=Actinomadura sp. 9N407 TaxID=3375154 RepID=UPI003794E61B